MVSFFPSFFFNSFLVIYIIVFKQQIGDHVVQPFGNCCYARGLKMTNCVNSSFTEFVVSVEIGILWEVQFVVC